MGVTTFLETSVKEFLEENGIHEIGTSPIGFPCGYYERREVSLDYSGKCLPTMRIVIYGYTLEVTIKSEKGDIFPKQQRDIEQINRSACIGLILRPGGLETFKRIILYMKTLGAVTAPYREAVEKIINSGNGIQYKF